MLDELERLLKDATPGPWVATPKTWKSKTNNYTWTACGIESRDPELVEIGGGAIAYAADTGQIAPANAALICAAVNALPALLRVARALQDLDALIDFSVPLDSAPMEFSDRTSINAAMARAHAALAALEEVAP